MNIENIDMITMIHLTRDRILIVLYATIPRTRSRSESPRSTLDLAIRSIIMEVIQNKVNKHSGYCE